MVGFHFCTGVNGSCADSGSASLSLFLSLSLSFRSDDEAASRIAADVGSHDIDLSMMLFLSSLAAGLSRSFWVISLGRGSVNAHHREAALYEPGYDDDCSDATSDGRDSVACWLSLKDVRSFGDGGSSLAHAVVERRYGKC